MYINEQRKRIASLILGVLNARIYRAKYKYKKESITSYSLQPFLNLNTHKCYLLVGNTQSDDRLERETRETSNTFLLIFVYIYIYIYIYISGADMCRFEAGLFTFC